MKTPGMFAHMFPSSNDARNYLRCFYQVFSHQIRIKLPKKIQMKTRDVFFEVFSHGLFGKITCKITEEYLTPGYYWPVTGVSIEFVWD